MDPASVNEIIEDLKEKNIENKFLIFSLWFKPVNDRWN